MKKQSFILFFHVKNIIKSSFYFYGMWEKKKYEILVFYLNSFFLFNKTNLSHLTANDESDGNDEHL